MTQERTPGLRYAVVTPCRNEATNLPRLGQALMDQTLQPAAWLIVNDASTDATRDVGLGLAERCSWISVLDWERDAHSDITQGRREGRDLLAFRIGVRAIPVDVDVVVKVDADVSFEPNYFEVLVGRFAARPDLGLASGTCWEKTDGAWRRRRVGDTSVWGASRAYRWSCVEVMDALEPRMGWDGIDEIKAQLLGYRTQTFTDLPFRHHRPEGGRERGRLRARSVQGRASWYMGYRPTYLALRSVYRAPVEPAALAMMWGYLAAAAARTPRCPDADVVTHLRNRQRVRHLLRARAV